MSNRRRPWLQEAQRSQTEYRESAERLSQWLRQNTSRLQDRTLPTSLVELRHLLTETKMFRTHDVPPRQQELRRVTDAYQQLQVRRLQTATRRTVRCVCV